MNIMVLLIVHGQLPPKKEGYNLYVAASHVIIDNPDSAVHDE
jgi:hypothetical protein